jgi:D-alanyl-D-alanine carboxypeptidase
MRLRSAVRRAVALTAVLSVFAVIANSADARPFDLGTQARLDRAVRVTMGQNWAPGVIAGVWKGDRSWTATQGLTSRTVGRRPRLTDHTRVGSVTKTFTGTLILQLVDEGKLSLDDTIERWFPQLPDANTITIRDLGSMASGIATYTANPVITNQYFADPQTTWNPATLIAGGADLPRMFPPGQGFFYSNTNFVMLGQIIEQVTGQPYAQVLRTKILEPLKLAATSYPSTTAIPAPHWNGYTVQGSDNGAALDATSWSPTFAATAGQMISTLGDLHRWTRALGRGTLLKPATQRARLVPNPASVGGGRAYLFALGDDHGWLAHDGEIPGFNSQIAYLPSLDATIVVLTNSDIGAATGPPSPAFFQALARVIAPENVPSD